MKRILWLAGALLLAAFALPAAALAQNAYTTDYVNLRAGPGYDYPIVIAVPANTGLQSYGCLGDWSWCDVSWGPYRGWMSGEFIAYVYNNQWVPLYDYGPRFGLPIIVFDFGLYWDRYYRNWPFYRDRDRWRRYDHDHHDDHRPPPHREPPHALPKGNGPPPPPHHYGDKSPPPKDGHNNPPPKDGHNNPPPKDGHTNNPPKGGNNPPPPPKGGKGGKPDWENN